jgi:signal transduction histidine kinase
VTAIWRSPWRRWNGRSGRLPLPTGFGDDAPVRTRSLRGRVAVAVLALLLAVLVGLGLVVNTVLNSRLESDLRQRLRDRAGLAEALAGQGLTSQTLGDRLTGGGITAAVTTTSGTTVGRDRPPVGPPNGSRPPFARTRPPAATDVTIVQSGAMLTASLTIDGARVTLSASAVDIDRTLSTLRNIEFVAGGTTLLVVALLLWRLVGVALAPLDRMTALAGRITAGARGGRLRPTRPTTEIGRTATAFDGMLDSLELAEAQARAAEARMRQFLADASHDLRTPLAGVITSAEQVLRDDPARLERELRLVELIREARRAARLVDGLLLIAQLDDDVRPTPVLVDLRMIASAAVERARSQPPPRAIRLDTTAADASVTVDPDSVHRVLINLIDNAGRFAPAGTGITVTVRPRGDVVDVLVHDDGPGVPELDRECIFDRFVRLADLADGRPAQGGHGLGLPIARGLVERDGGTLTYLADGPGATFRITYPSAATATADPADAAAAVPVNAATGQVMLAGQNGRR